MKISYNSFRVFLSMLSCAVGLNCPSLCGAIFDYSYSFPDGLVVSGTLKGDQNGSYVDNVHDVTVFFNGTPMVGTVYTAQHTGPGGVPQWVPGPVVSFDAWSCNLMFINSDIANGDYGFSAYFEINQQNAGYAESIDGGGGYHLDTTEAGWSLQPVPEPSTYLAGLSALGMLGVFSWRNRK